MSLPFFSHDCFQPITAVAVCNAAIIILEPHAFDPEFQHFISIFNNYERKVQKGDHLMDIPNDTFVHRLSPYVSHNK
jgi:hypothetical protein